MSLSPAIQYAVDEGHAQARRIVLEVMREVYARLPYGTAFKLSDGSTGEIAKFSEPEECEDGIFRFGFDVQIQGGKLDHIEFFVTQTGWGGLVINGAAA
jgi:hypothetical protein